LKEVHTTDEKSHLLQSTERPLQPAGSWQSIF